MPTPRSGPAALLVALAFCAPLTAQDQPLAIPDFTKGEVIPKAAEHDWNLGPTGARGWMFCDRMVTTDARQVAITKVAKSGNSSLGATLYVTASPCIECSKLIIQAGIKRVVYKDEYRLTDGVDLLRKAGIKVEKID